MLLSPFAIPNFKCLIVLFNELITYFCYASRSHANVFQHAQLTGSFDTIVVYLTPFNLFFCSCRTPCLLQSEANSRRSKSPLKFAKRMSFKIGIWFWKIREIVFEIVFSLFVVEIIYRQSSIMLYIPIIATNN